MELTYYNIQYENNKQRIQQQQKKSRNKITEFVEHGISHKLFLKSFFFRVQ